MGKDGFSVVAIIGGEEKGMEIWNPRTSTVELLWDEIPPETGGTRGLGSAEMIPTSGGLDFILYGGSHEVGPKSDIWKYTAAGNKWDK